MTAVMEPLTTLSGFKQSTTPSLKTPTTPDTVTQLVDLYTSRREQLVRLASRYTRDRDRAEDAVQEAFLNLVGNPKPERITGELASTLTKYGAIAEAAKQNTQIPVGEAMDWQPDTTPPADDLDTLAACMGDPVVAARVEEALATLTPLQQQAVRMYCFDRKMPAVIAAELGIDRKAAYSRVADGLARLELVGFTYDEDEQAVQAVADTATVPDEAAPKRSGARPVASDEELVATLDREFPGVWVGPRPAEAFLRRAHGKVSTVRAIRAQKAHNESCPKPASKNRATGLANGFANRQALTSTVTPAVNGEGPVVTTDPATRTVATTTVQASAPVAGRGPTVAEVWLMGAKPPISCLLVHVDETTASRGLAAVSMLGAQREITGQLIGEGYRPDGPWVDVDPAAPEAMRKFHAQERSPR